MHQKYWLHFFVCLLAACLTQFASDIYAPSLPKISMVLQAPIAQVQWSMAVYLIAVSLSLLIYGPISEAIGRKKPILIGLLILFFGSVIAGMASNIETLILGRVIQGCGTGATAGLWGSIFRDLFSGNKLSKYASLIATFIMFSLSLAPVIGGFLESLFTWRASFVFIALYSLVTFFVVLFVYRETSRHHTIEHFQLSFVYASYKELFSHRAFLGITLCNFLSHGAYFALFVVSPVLLIQHADVSPAHYGLLVGIGSTFAYLLSGEINTRYVIRLGRGFMMRLGWAIMILSGVLLLCLPVLWSMRAVFLAIPMVLFFFGSTFIWPNAFSYALSPFPHIAGYASISYRLMLLSGGAVVGSIAAYLPSTTASPLAWVWIVCSGLAWAIYESFVRRATSR